MRKFQSRVPGIFYCILFMVLTVAVFLCLEESDVKTEAQTRQSASEPSAAESIAPVSEPTAVTDTPSFVYSDTVPRAARSDEKFLYTQSLYGEGDITLRCILPSPLGIFVVAESSAEKGDICGAEPCLGVVRLDAVGNIESVYTLNPTSPFFIAASLSVRGLVLVATDADRKFFYVYLLDYDFGGIASYKISPALHVRVLPTEDAFLVFADYKDECLVYTFRNGKFIFQSIDCGSTVDVFEYADSYTVFGNTEDESGFFAIKLDKTTLSVLSKTEKRGSKLLKAVPFTEDGAQKYFTVEVRSAVYAVRYDGSFSTEKERKLGIFSVEHISAAPSSVLMLCSGNLTGTVRISFDLTGDFSEQSAFTASRITDTYFTGSVLYCAALTDDGKLALYTLSSESCSVSYPNISCENALLTVNPNGTLTLFCSDTDTYRHVDIFGVEKP